MFGDGADSAAVTNVEDVDVFVDDQDDDGTRTSFVVRLVRRWSRQLQKVFLRDKRTLPNCLWDVAGELRLKNDIVVEIVLQVLCTLTATVTVVDTEDLQFRPFVRRDSRSLLRGLYHI